MAYRVRIDGIYDQRTLKHLKLSGVKDFCFEFSPKSFNFVQEHVFLEQLIPLFSEDDRVFVHFNRSNDPMVMKLGEDMARAGLDLKNVFFEFDVWSADMDPQKFNYNYLLYFSNDQDVSKGIGNNFCGFFFDFSFFEDLYHKNVLQRFASNFYTRFGTSIDESKFFIMKMNWSSNLITSLFDFFEFTTIAMPINSDIEICYRNVDLKKLSNEMLLLKKNRLLRQEF